MKVIERDNLTEIKKIIQVVIMLKEKKYALSYALRKKEWVKKKADKNRRVSNILMISILISSGLSPILILFNSEKYLTGFWVDFFSKILPAMFTFFAALATSWCQLRKPQERWILQRTIENEIEYEITKFKYRIEEYSGSNPTEKILVQKVNNLILKLHYKWVEITPTSKELSDKKLKNDKKVGGGNG